jgi:DnaJ-class molecular chaperone
VKDRSLIRFVIAAIFLKLTQAVDILTDEQKKSEYDVLHKGRLQQKERTAKLDAKRRQERNGMIRLK